MFNNVPVQQYASDSAIDKSTLSVATPFTCHVFKFNCEKKTKIQIHAAIRWSSKNIVYYSAAALISFVLTFVLNV